MLVRFDSHQANSWQQYMPTPYSLRGHSPHLIVYDHPLSDYSYRLNSREDLVKRGALTFGTTDFNTAENTSLQKIQRPSAGAVGAERWNSTRVSVHFGMIPPFAGFEALIALRMPVGHTRDDRDEGRARRQG